MMMSSGIFLENKNILFSKGFLGVYTPIPRSVKVAFFPVVLTLASSTFSLALREFGPLLTASGTVVEDISFMMRGLGITVENSLMGQRFAGVPSNLLQNSKGVGSPGIVTSLPW